MDSDLEDIFDDDNDEEIINYAERSYTVRIRPDHFDNWNDKEFFQRFRFLKRTVLFILEQIHDMLSHKTDRNHALSPTLQLLIALRFFATGDMYIVVGDFGGIHKTTAGKVIKKVTEALLSLRDRYIYMPRNANELRASQEHFYNIARFPRAIGAVDCTHIRMLSPGGPQAENFRNRKGYFSLNVQAICSAENIITDIVARWPGAVHDSTIFDQSAIRARFEAGLFMNGVLLGDIGYPLRSYLMTPLANPRNNAEELYNQSQIKTRTIIERTFGIMKRRFPVLSIGMRCKIQLMQDIIVAAAILNNIAIKQNDLIAEEPLNDDEPENEINVQNNIVNNIQQEIIEYFRTLL